MSKSRGRSASKRSREEDEWSAVEISTAAQNTSNPIRAIVDRIKPNPAATNRLLALSIGDPTLDGNLLPPANAVAAIKDVIDKAKHNGYLMSHGLPAARAAVATYHSTHFAPTTRFPFTGDHVVLTSGASQALELAIGALLNPGDVLLLPHPGFTLYDVIAANRGIKTDHYRCTPETEWHVDLAHLTELLAKHGRKVKGLLLNNPSNPCGSVFNREHVADLLKLADRFRVPVIADEIYAGMVFDGSTHPFTSVADIPDCVVPRIIVGGTAKNYVAPGWRLGWCLRCDPSNLLAEVWPGIINMSQIILGPCALIQGALPNILLETPPAYTATLNATLAQHAEVCFQAFSACKGLSPVMPRGAMYMLVRLDFAAFARKDFDNDVDFASKLFWETNVMVLPGTIFGAKDFFRIVFTKPIDQLRDAVSRIASFCSEAPVSNS